VYAWLYVLTSSRNRSDTRTHWLVHAPVPADRSGSLHPLERWYISYALPIDQTLLSERGQGQAP